MWPQKNLKILVPRTPPDPPLPPLTPPRGPGGPKMAKMHSLKSIDDNLCQKSHFWGVKKIDLFFHSECTIREVQPRQGEALNWCQEWSVESGPDAQRLPHFLLSHQSGLCVIADLAKCGPCPARGRTSSAGSQKCSHSSSSLLILQFLFS